MADDVFRNWGHEIDAALDAALNYIKTNGTMLHICTSEPANYAGIAGADF